MAYIEEVWTKALFSRPTRNHLRDTPSISTSNNHTSVACVEPNVIRDLAALDAKEHSIIDIEQHTEGLSYLLNSDNIHESCRLSGLGSESCVCRVLPNMERISYGRVIYYGRGGVEEMGRGRS